MTNEYVEPTGEHAAEAETGPNRRSHRNLISAFRVVVGAIGLLGFVLGGIVAWRSSSATTLVVVSGVLLILGALGFDWESIRGSYGGLTLEVLRNLGTRLDEVTQTAAAEDVPQALREELESLRAEVLALTPRPRPRPRASNADIDTLLAEMARTGATHSFRGTDAVELKLRTPRASDRYRCTVTTPGGTEFTAVTRRPLNIGIGAALGTTYRLLYPDEFEGSEPLTPGRYEVAWRPGRPPDSSPDPSGASTLVRSLVEAATPPVATDSFSIPDPPSASVAERSQP